MYIKLEDGIFLIGSGLYGLSHWKDCSIYLITDGIYSAIIDAGVGLDNEQIYHNFLESGVKPETVIYFLLTHAHGDHAGGLCGLKQYFPNAKIMTSSGEADLVESGSDDALGLSMAKARGAYPENYKFAHVKVDKIVEDEHSFPMGKMQITPYIVAGHTKESVLYLVKKDKKSYLFCGDYIFLRGIIGLLNCPGSSLEGYRQSLPRIGKLSIDALLPGHREFALNNAQRFLEMAVKNIQSTLIPPVM